MHAVAKVVLSAPRLAAKAAAEATKSTREAAEGVIVAAVQDCLHLLGALKLVMPALSEAAALRVSEHVLAMLSLNQPLLTMHGVDCLIRALQSSASGGATLPPARIQQLLSVRPPSPPRRAAGAAAGGAPHRGSARPHVCTHATVPVSEDRGPRLTGAPSGVVECERRSTDAMKACKMDAARLRTHATPSSGAPVPRACEVYNLTQLRVIHAGGAAAAGW